MAERLADDIVQCRDIEQRRDSERDDAAIDAAFAELQQLLDARFARGPIRMSCCHRPVQCRGCPRYRL